MSSVIHRSTNRTGVSATVGSVACLAVLPIDMLSGSSCARRSMVAKAVRGNTRLSGSLAADVRAALLVASVDVSQEMDSGDGAAAATMSAPWWMVMGWCDISVNAW